MTIRLQFSTSTELSSMLIRRICHSPFSHVDILDADGNCIGASNSPKAPVLYGNPAGVACRPVEYQVFGTRHIAVLDTSEDVEERFHLLVQSQIGKPFDDTAIKAFLGNPDDEEVVRHRDWRALDAWFCSEFAVWCLEQAGFFDYALIVGKNAISPADLLHFVNRSMLNIPTFWDDPYLVAMNLSAQGDDDAAIH